MTARVEINSEGKTKEGRDGVKEVLNHGNLIIKESERCVWDRMN